VGGGLIGLFEAVGRVSPRRATHFSLFRQRKVSKRKATPLCVSLRFASGNLRCSLQAGSAQTRCAQTRAALFPPEAALLGTHRGDPNTNTNTKAERAMARPCVVLAVGIRWAERSDGPSTPFCGCRGAELFVDQGRACLSRRRVSRGPHEKRAPQVARSEAKGRPQQGRLFFAYFLLAKQKKVSRPPGRDPANSLNKGPQGQKDPSP
jgi:hypothetical protein